MMGWPFDSTVTTDTEGNPIYSRAYSADVIATVLRKYFRNGVFGNPSTGLQVLAGEGMTVVVQPGEALINGRHCYEESERVLVHQAANASLDRIDTVVLRLNLAVDALSIDLYVVQGTPAATPAAPAMTRNAQVWELVLADVFIAKNTTTITQQRITDTRLDSDRCGVVASIIGDTDTSTYYAQLEAVIAQAAADLAAGILANQSDWDAWFTAVQTELGEDVAGNLLLLINKYKAKNAVITLTVADWTLSSGVYVQTESVAIVPANCAIHVAPAWASHVAYNDAECGMSAASAGSVTFTASTIPAAELTVNISVSEVDA